MYEEMLWEEMGVKKHVVWEETATTHHTHIKPPFACALTLPPHPPPLSDSLHHTLHDGIGLVAFIVGEIGSREQAQAEVAPLPVAHKPAALGEPWVGMGE